MQVDDRASLVGGKRWGKNIGEGRRLARGAGWRGGGAGWEDGCRLANRGADNGAPVVIEWVHRVLVTTVSSAGVALLSRVRRVLPTTEGAALLAGTEGSPGVGYYREFGGCCLTLEGSAGVAYYRGCCPFGWHRGFAGCWLLPCGGRRVLATTMWRRRAATYRVVERYVRSRSVAAWRRLRSRRHQVATLPRPS